MGVLSSIALRKATAESTNVITECSKIDQNLAVS